MSKAQRKNQHFHTKATTQNLRENVIKREASGITENAPLFTNFLAEMRILLDKY